MVAWMSRRSLSKGSYEGEQKQTLRAVQDNRDKDQARGDGELLTMLGSVEVASSDTGMQTTESTLNCK